MMVERLRSVCEQLIEQGDLEIDDRVAKELDRDDITLQIIHGEVDEIKIYSISNMAICDIIPILSDFGFRTLNEITYESECNSRKIFVTKLRLGALLSELLLAHKVNIKELLLKALQGKISSSKLLRLVYLENFNEQEIVWARALSSYAGQIFTDFNRVLFELCIIRHHSLFALLKRYFLLRFDPAIVDRQKQLDPLLLQIEERFKEIQSISDDRALRRAYEILQSLVRTNYFDKKHVVLALKFDVAKMTHMLSGVQPKFETFVYSHYLKGTHLRISKVCRGGIRWSNRDEDFRTEVRSLMITQEAKNSVIVPKGAKGGFIITEPKLTSEKFELYYEMFINALLDVVDNQKDGKIIKNSNYVSYDGDDSYFVVAADKGTSSMSDRANKIAKERNFWLQDAFASGSSSGYHHKRLGVTAKGALKASERFFIERGINFYKEPITIVGIGSMSGDVFGNGLIESEKFRLLAAISSDEIFVDPDPDLLVAYKERKRLFVSSSSRWSNYDKSKISKGGAVFKRANKQIHITPEISKLIQSDSEFLSGEELARELLRLPVDMLYFGGIGTYVKSSTQSNISLGDKENEFVRIDANQIRAKVVCEGANLALTMEARVEYALCGGKINLDSIDNSAGVDTSDHEVNLKILLNALLQKKIINEEEKRRTLQSVCDNVVGSIMWTNYLQSLAISLDAKRSQTNIEVFKESLATLEENLDVFKRKYFNIPKDHNFDEAIGVDGKIIRPILATMILYAKILLQELLCDSGILKEDNFFKKYLFKYFPKSLVAIYEDEILLHPLKEQIAATVIANKIINQVGVSFIGDFKSLGKAKFMFKIKAYLVTNQLFDADDIRYKVYRSDYDMEYQKQYEILLKIEDDILYNIEWMLKHNRDSEINFNSILEYKSGIKDAIGILEVDPLMQKNETEQFFANLTLLKFASAVIKLDKISKAEFKDSAKIFYALVHRLDIVSLFNSLEMLVAKSDLDAILQTQAKELLESSLVYLSSQIIMFKREDEEPLAVISSYFREHDFRLDRYDRAVASVKDSTNLSIESILVATNHLLLLK